MRSDLGSLNFGSFVTKSIMTLVYGPSSGGSGCSSP
jgi:hypothetical protein